MAKRNTTTRSQKSKPNIEVAHHEAGHAVAAHFLRLSIGRRGATIVADEEASGRVHLPPRLRENDVYSMSAATVQRIEKLAIASLAGDAAGRKYNPRHRGSDVDCHYAMNLLDSISGSARELEARLNLAAVQASDLVENRWTFIESVAKALLEKKTLGRDEVANIIYGVIRSHLPQLDAGQISTFEVKPPP